MKNIYTKILAFALLTISLAGAAGCGNNTPPPHEHSPEAGWKSDETNHWHTCADCDELLDVANHVYGEWVVTKEATCKEPGIKEKECRVCGYKVTEEIPKTTEHTWGDWVVTKEATCKEPGTKEKVCTVCGEKVTEEIPRTTEHTWGDWVTETEATCTEKGMDKRTCTVCGVFEVREVPAKGHTFGSYEMNPKPTYETEGALVLHCADCEYTESIVLPKLDDVHYYLDEYGDCMEGIEKTYSLKITEEFVAKFEGTMLEGNTEKINAIANLTIVVTEGEATHRDIQVDFWDTPTPTKQGKIKVSCSFCEKFKYYYLPKLSYSNYTITDKGNGYSWYEIKEEWFNKQTFVKDFGTYCETKEFKDAVLLAGTFSYNKLELVVDTQDKIIWKHDPIQLMIREKGSTDESGVILKKQLPSYNDKPTYYKLGTLTGVSCQMAVWFTELTETGITELKLDTLLPEGQKIRTILNGQHIVQIMPDTQEETETARLDHNFSIAEFDGGQTTNGQGLLKLLCSKCNSYQKVTFQYYDIFIEVGLGEYAFSLDALMDKVEAQLPRLRATELTQIRGLLETRMEQVPQDFVPIE